MKIIGTGSAHPKCAVTNHMLEQFLETSDEWITERTGIKERCVVSTEKLEELAVEAANKALEDAGLTAADIDFIICSNVVNEYVIIEKEKLEADKELKTALHTQWAQQLMLAKAKVQEKTPVFVTLKPATMPAEPSSMGRMVKTVLFAFIGAVFAILYILMKDSAMSAWRKIRRKSE